MLTSLATFTFRKTFTPSHRQSQIISALFLTPNLINTSPSHCKRETAFNNKFAPCFTVEACTFLASRYQREKEMKNRKPVQSQFKLPCHLDNQVIWDLIFWKRMSEQAKPDKNVTSIDVHLHGNMRQEECLLLQDTCLSPTFQMLTVQFQMRSQIRALPLMQAPPQAFSAWHSLNQLLDFSGQGTSIKS